MKKILIILLFLFSYSYTKTLITVTYPFQEYFIKKIANDKFYIRTVFSKKHDFDINNKKLVRQLSSSEYYLSLNLKEEKEVLKSFKNKNKNLKIIDTRKNIGNIIEKDGSKNPYFWLDPILAREFASNIYEVLSKIRSYDKKLFKENYENFLKELDETYLSIKLKIDNSNLYGFFAFNNNFDYFAKRFRIEVYHKENRRLFINEVSKTIRFSQKEHIHHILMNENSDYTIAQSLSGHINGKIIELDIYDRNWHITLFKLVRGITHFN